MQTLPHRLFQPLLPLAPFARNASLLALVCAAHGLLGWWLWAQGQASTTPPKPLNAVEVLLLPETSARPVDVLNNVPSSAPKRAAAQPARPVAQAKPNAVLPTEPPALPPAGTPTAQPVPEAVPTATAPTAAAAPPNGSAAEARNPGNGEGNTTAPSFGAAYLNNPNPVYPAVSRQLNEQGRVLLRVHVGADGQVLDLEIKSSSGFARLDKSARDAVQRWRFVPAQQGGQAVAAWVLVPISFSLKG